MNEKFAFFRVSLISLGDAPYPEDFFGKFRNFLGVSGAEFGDSAGLKVAFQEDHVSASEESDGGVDLLCDVGTVRFFRQHFLDLVEHSSGFFDSHEDF
jgi:hypothetical protein